MRTILLSLVCLLTTQVIAERPKVGLALSGGGARGAAHIGVLKELERLNIPVDYIAGTSMGAIVGGMYASGYSIEEIEQLMNTTDWQAAFKDDVSRSNKSFRRKLDNRRFISSFQLGLDDSGLKLPTGIVSGQSIGLLLNKHLAPVSHITHFDELPIPFRAVATDLPTGKEVILHEGSLVKALTASMSIPGFLIPVQDDTFMLVDGGVANNLPISVVRNMGADIVIAVDISTPLFQRKNIRNVVDIAEQMTSILTRRNTQRQIQLLNEKDILIVPDLDEIATADFDKSEMAIDIGSQVARNSEKLEQLSKSLNNLPQPVDFQFKRRQSKQQWIKTEQHIVQDIIIDNRSSVPSARIKNKLTISKGKTFSLNELESNINAIYGMGFFDLVQYSLEPINEKVVVNIYISEKPWGPNYLRLGFNFSASENIDNKFTLSADYLMTQLNTLSGELSAGITIGNDRAISLNYYQPLDSRWAPFLETQADYRSEQFNFFQGDTLVAEYTTKSTNFDLALGFEFDNWGEFRIGANYLDGKIEQRVGLPVFNEFSFQDANDYVKFEVDTLDSVYFPLNGFLFQSLYSESNATLGSEFNYRQSKIRLLKAFQWQESAITLGVNVLRSKGTQIPLNAYYRSGGLLNFSGYEINQISSENAANVFVAYLQKIKPVEWVDMYAGISYERGQTWNAPDTFDWDQAINGFSVFLGADTKIGPFYVAYGKNETSEALYVMLDKLF